MAERWCVRSPKVSLRTHANGGWCAMSHAKAMDVRVAQPQRASMFPATAFIALCLPESGRHYVAVSPTTWNHAECTVIHTLRLVLTVDT